MYKKIAACYFLFLLANTSATAANLYIIPAPGEPNNGYIMYGSIVESDLTLTGINSRWAKIHSMYELTGGNYWESLNNETVCPISGSTLETVQFLNGILSKGIYLNKKARYAPMKEFRLTIYCTIDGRGGKRGSWEIKPLIAIPPVPPESPRCNTTIDPNINFGTVNVGQTTNISTIGKISCDKDAMVNISLMNRESLSTTNGILKLDDATILFDIDGESTSKKYKILKNLNENFTLNFTLSDTGKKIAHKSGALILKIDVL